MVGLSLTCIVQVEVGREDKFMFKCVCIPVPQALSRQMGLLQCLYPHRPSPPVILALQQLVEAKWIERY